MVEEPSEFNQSLISAHWRTYGAIIAQGTADDIPDFIEDLLSALGERVICYRSAGRLFAAIEDRRRQLHNQAAQRRVMELAESFANFQHPSGDGPFAPQGRSQLPSLQLITPLGPMPENASR